MAKTSVEILEERNGLAARVDELEHALATIRAEIARAREEPAIGFTTLCRIESVVDRALERPSAKRLTA
jgi:hypothetical protein